MNWSVPFADYRGLLGTYLRPQRGRVALLAALLAGSIGLQLLNPQILRGFIEATQTQGAPTTLFLAALAFLGVGIMQRVVALATTYVSLNVGWTATNALRADLTLHCLRLDMPFHKTHTPGELIERVDGDVSLLANFFAQFAVRAVGNALLVLGILLLMFREDWRAGLVLTLYTLVVIGALAALQNYGVRRFLASRQASAEMFGFLEERFAGTEDIRGVGAEGYVMQRLYGLMRNFTRTARQGDLAGSLGYVVTTFFFITGYGLGLALGAILYQGGNVTIGTAFLIVYYVGMMAEPLDQIRWQAHDLQRATSGITRIRELFLRRPLVQETAQTPLPAGALAVTFDHVSFAYDDDPAAKGATDQEPEEDDTLDLVLHDVVFDLPPGRILGVLGRTGSGKTTITRLLFRLYDPTEGQIRLGGVAMRDAGFADLRARVGMVTQDVQLFQASVRDNLTFFNPRIDDSRLAHALAELGLTDWVATMPDGLDTRLASGGGGMSAGEAQLLAFTRVLLKEPGLIILDEAASRLDPVTEARLERAVDRLLAGRTGIIIAHRLHTVQRADDILILEEGRVVEYSPRAQLAADPTSRFARLLQTGLEEALV
jgi:ATP-binding cassette subfamily B protein/ATP-binding cassette subfamily C protein